MIKVPLTSNSTTKVTKEMYLEAKQSTTGCAFVKKILTNLGSVKDFYKRSTTGVNRANSSSVLGIKLTIKNELIA